MIDGVIDVSVIIPARDPDPEHLTQQLAALAAQEDPPAFEVVGVDNGSRRPLREQGPDRVGSAPVRVVEAPYAAGINVARVAGVRAARADLMVCCDSDDVVAPRWLAAAHRELVTGDVLVGGPVRGFREVIGDSGPAHPADSLAEVAGRPFASGCNVGFTRGVIERTGGFDESWPADGSAEDLDFSWRCAEAGLEARFAPEMVVEYRLRTDLRGVFRQRRFYGRGDICFSDRHGWPRGRSGCRRRVLGQLKGIVWFLPRAVTEPRGSWHLARRVGLVVGHLEGLLRPVDRRPVRGVSLDLRDPTATVVLGPVRSRHDLESAMAVLAHRYPRVEVVAIVDATAGASSWSGGRPLPIRTVDGGGRTVAESRNRAVATVDRDLIVFLDPDAVDLAALDRHLDVLERFEVSAGRSASWVTTRRSGRRLVPDTGALGIRRSAFQELGGFAGDADGTAVARAFGDGAGAAGFRVADLTSMEREQTDA